MERNPVFDTAVEFINNTSRPVFLTGKAGTGKTTFLRYIRENTKKKCVVVAPTGVAAINANGVTMHSMFQLPFTPFIPVSQRFTVDGTTDKHSLFQSLRINNEKRNIIRELELIIIDEVSMVRCDTLDAMDVILRYVRGKPNKPFGGIQVLFIGDLFQLPPVMPDNDWNILRQYYESPFFFHAKVIEQCQLINIELKKIYRQNEQRFIDLLNRVRNGDPSEDDLQLLNDRLFLDPDTSKKYVTLTSHNYKADKINNAALAKLPGKEVEFKGSVEGEFPEKTLPTDVTLVLKVGAQVMFIRNDKSDERRYYNGLIATVSEINGEGVRVTVEGTGKEILLEKENWENIQYSYNEKEGKIDAEVIGAFSQYPVRLAWAITIHKSQGLTFTNAIIDAGDSFAAGQVYVALSRCTTLDGLILHSRLSRKSISTDPRIMEFSTREKSLDDLHIILHEERELYTNSQMLQAFDFTDVVETFQNHRRYVTSNISDNKLAVAFAKDVTGEVEQLQNVSEKFGRELERLLREKNLTGMQDRIPKAVKYFLSLLTEKIIKLIDEHSMDVKKGKGIKKYIKRLMTLRSAVVSKARVLSDLTYGDLRFSNEMVEIPSAPKSLAGKTAKGESVGATLELIEEGKSLSEIASIRGFTLGTIESHVAKLVRDGRLEISKVLSPEKVNAITQAANALETRSLNAVKQSLGSRFSFGEIRAVLAHLDRKVD